MRRKFIENYNFFKFLGELSNLPDKCSSEPYYFKDSNKLDSYLVFYRLEDVDESDLPHFQIFFNCKESGTRSVKNYTYNLFEFDLYYKLIRESILLINFRYIDDFLSYLCSFSSEFKEKLESFKEYYENFNVSKDYTLI